MAMLESVTRMRSTLAFMGAAYQPLMTMSSDTLVPPSRNFVLLEHEKPTGLRVGRLHYSLSSTLSAHFRWCFCASDLLYIAS